MNSLSSPFSAMQSNTTAEAMVESMRKTKLYAPLSMHEASFSTSTGQASPFAALGDPSQESCWAKAARKNSDKGVKPLRTFDIINRRQDVRTKVSKPKQNHS